MPTFICAVHADGDTPRAYALVEQTAGPDGAVYEVRRLHALSGDDPRAALADALADEPQFAATATVVTTGGQRAADALRKTGPSAVAVNLLDGTSGAADSIDVSEQTLVDTFELLYRDGAVVVPGTLDEGSHAVTALYRGADLEAAAPDGDRDEEGDLEGDAPAPGADTVRQSGGEAGVSTGTVDGRRNTEMVDADAPRVGRIAATTGAAAPDLGEHRDVALALALACWYGEYAADELPVTDQADPRLGTGTRR